MTTLADKLIPNPSGQDQFQTHFLPSFFITNILLSIPKVGIYAGLAWVAVSLYKELVEDLHYKDLLSRTESGADGRCDLFFRLTGCAVAYLIEMWR